MGGSVKKVYFSLVVLLLLTPLGCSASRTVKSNIFESSSPQISIRVAQEFTYFRRSIVVEHHRSLRGDRMLKNKVERYYFFAKDPDKNHMIQKSVVLGIRESEGILAGDLFPREKELEHGVETLSEENYEFSTQLGSMRMPESIAKALKAAGHNLPRCLLVKQYRKIVLDDRKQLKFIDYWEDAAVSGHACNTWTDANKLSDGQKAYLKEFNKRASEAFTIMPAPK